MVCLTAIADKIKADVKCHGGRVTRTVKSVLYDFHHRPVPFPSCVRQWRPTKDFEVVSNIVEQACVIEDI